MRGRALYRAAASGRRFSSWDSKLLAGAAFVPAGFSSGTGVCARGERREVIRNAEFGMRNWGAGDERARHCGSVAAVCRRFAHGIAVLLRRFASVHACLFSFVRKKETACDVLRFYSAGSRSPFVRSRYVCMVICLWQVHFGFVRFFMAISTGYRDAGNGDTGYGDGGAAFVRFCASTLALKCFPRGVRWGYAPQTAPKSLRLYGLSSRCGGAVSAQIRCACAFLRNHIGLAMLSAGSTLGLNVEAALRPPQTAPKSLRLSGLSSGAGRVRKCALRGGVALVRIRGAVTRAHG